MLTQPKQHAHIVPNAVVSNTAAGPQIVKQDPNDIKELIYHVFNVFGDNLCDK